MTVHHLPDRRPPLSALGAGHGEIETAFLAGFRSLRAWRWARRKGGFPAPVMTTPDGPLWSEGQIAGWLGVPVPANDNDDDDETALLRELEAA